ncbi:MAG TPA: hypothetical protein VHG28_01890, partial [Longimicrobiaceae bacterium]|nr:hypothetical protein [Longimicrobiaceae bacterium]
LLPGIVDVGLAADARRVPVSLEVGVARRLNLRVTVPIERRETELAGVRIVGGAIGTRGSLTAAQRDSLSRMLGEIDVSLRAVARQPFLPLRGSRVGLAMQERYRRATGDPTPLPLPTRGLLPADLNALLREERLDTLAFRSSSGEYGLGDVEVAAKLQLLGNPTGALSPGLTGSRIAVEAGVRLPTAMGTGPDSLIELVSDAGHAGATAALFADLALARRLWVGAYARYAALLPQDVERHVLLPAPPSPRLGELRTVSRDPGDRVEVAVAPHLQVTDELALSGRYGFARIGETVYEEGPDGEGSALAGLESVAARSVQSLGFGMTYSTLGAFAAGRAGIPLEVWLTYENVITGTGGAEDAKVVRVAGRLFYQFWARRRAAR